MFIQLDVGMDVSKHYFLKTFFLSFAASSSGETLFCDCANTHFLIMSFLFLSGLFAFFAMLSEMTWFCCKVLDQRETSKS